MRITFVFVLLAVISIPVATQTQRKGIVWGGEAACGFKTAGIAAHELVTCSSMETPRGKISIINHNELSLGVAFLEEDEFIIVGTLIKNGSTVNVDFDTDLWGAAHYERAEDFTDEKKPIIAETAIPSRDLLRGIMSGSARDTSADVYTAGIAKTSVKKEITRPDGTKRTVDVIVDDKDAQRDAGFRSESRRQLSAEQQRKIRAGALTQKWVAPNGEAKGLVYFRRVKTAKFVVFSFKILDTVYVFRLHRGKN